MIDIYFENNNKSKTTVQKKIKIKKISYLETINEFDLNKHLNWLNNEYLAEKNGRSDILINLDIFEENARSKHRVYKDFNFFEVVEKIEKDTFIVVGLYLELLQFWQETEKLKKILSTYCNRYKNNKVIFYWNHDVDFAEYNQVIEKLENSIILNYNTSNKTKNDIVLPFWTYNINDDIEKTMQKEKSIFSNLSFTINNDIRTKLFYTFSERSDYVISKNLPYDQFKKIIMSSKFTFCPKGIGLSSYRFFETMRLGSVPVLFSDNVVLPYEDEINYNELIVRIPEEKCHDYNYINNKLKNTNHERLIQNIQNKIKFFRLDGIQEYIFKKIK